MTAHDGRVAINNEVTRIRGKAVDFTCVSWAARRSKVALLHDLLLPFAGAKSILMLKSDCYQTCRGVPWV
jgi:hypothetical protein